MERTFIEKINQIKLNNPILIEGLPGLGLVGKITVQYLIKHLKSKKLAHLYSPHFPYYVLVNNKGSVRLLRGAFYFYKNEKGLNDLILFTGDSQAQTIEGQYEISNHILNFAREQGVEIIITIGGYRMEVEGKPKVIAVATNRKLLDQALQSKAVLGSMGSPIVGTAGLILGLAHFKQIDALCLLGETRGYLPDPRSAKSVLGVLNSLLDISIDLSGLNKEIIKANKMITRLQKIEEKRSLQEEMRKREDKRVTYIS
ncbi:MAG: PAC2 family protein [Candidatus Bathyarchaeota archaeon]|jgi:uncharacterized protein (TIGR00162 family)